MGSAGVLTYEEAERLRAFERQGHDALAKSYHEFFAAVTALATDALFDDVHLHPGAHLLDVASGPGALTAEAANRGARAVGVDLSPQMIELAHRLYPTIEYREADVEHLPFPDHTFDAVVCALRGGTIRRASVFKASSARPLPKLARRHRWTYHRATMCFVFPTRGNSSGCWKELASRR
jgi:SAM-dependent methyltransferase